MGMRERGGGPEDFPTMVRLLKKKYGEAVIWVVVKIKVLFWVPIIIRHLLFRVPKKGP